MTSCLNLVAASLVAAGLALPAAATPVVDDATPGAAKEARSLGVTRIVLRLEPGSHPREGETLSGRKLADLKTAVGRPFTIGTPTRTGDQVLVLTEPVTPAEAKALVGALRMHPRVMRADVERESRVPASALARAKTANDSARVRYFIVTFSDPATRALAESNQKLSVDHDAFLSSAAGVAMRVVRPTANGAWVVEVVAPVGGQAARDIVERLDNAPGITHAEPVLREKPHAAFHPNDPYYGNYSQWDLDDPYNGKYYGIDAARAWGITVGSPSIRVAIVDTGGINHPDLVDRWVTGYDFISDDDPVRDGNGRDGNAIDPGDYSLAGECGEDEEAEDSSWHGSHVAGTIGAAANNGYGTAGIDHRAGLVAVRALGPCGGSSLDINEGMYWAAGGHVPGIPDNPLPARVINMSLGGKGVCSASRQALIDKTLSLGALVVVSAGNDNDNADLYTPASCYGVSAVGATDAYGYMASYSNYSPYLDISAPGGDQGFYDDETEGIFSTVDTSKGAPSYNYGFEWLSGTSMAAPHVSGVASLMLSVNPSLTPVQMKGIMANTATSFNLSSQCRTDNDCGAGIVNAYYAVLEAAELLNVPTVQVIEYYHQGLNHYFMAATSQPDVPALDSGAIPGWVRTGQAFNAYATLKSGLEGVCRFYIPPHKGNSHFYTATDSECNAIYDALTNPQHPGHATYAGFVYENSAAFVLDVPVDKTCPPTRVPVWRLWNQRIDSNHRYVTTLQLRAQMIAQGFVDEGIQMCALQ